MKKLEINKISVAYNDNQVLNNIDMVVKNNQRLVILGPSGCGKSTLLKVIAGLLKPSSGEVFFEDKILFSKNKGIDILPEKREMGFVFQNYALWPHMTVYDNIAYPLKVRHWSKDKIKNRINNLLDIMNLSEKKYGKPNELSGGERQRVALARALAFYPKMLLLDEPLANVDAALKTQLISLILEMCDNLKIPMIYVTHDQQEAFEVADSIAVMREGKILQIGTPKQIYSEPKNEFVAEFVGNSMVINDGKIKKAVKPQDIKIHPKGRCRGCVKRVVYKGNCCHLHVDDNKKDIVISVDSEEYKVGENIRFDIQKAHIIEDTDDREMM